MRVGVRNRVAGVKALRWGGALMALLVFASCAGHRIGIKGPGRCLRDLERDPAVQAVAEEHPEVRALLATAARLTAFQPARAAGHYFQAAEEARRSGGGEGAERLFAHAIGHGTALVHELGAWEDGRSFRGRDRSYRVALDLASPHTVDPRRFDDLFLAERLEIAGFDQVVAQEGAGAPMVGKRGWSADRKRENRFLHSGGTDAAVTMWAEISPDGLVTCRCLNPRKVVEVRAGDRRKPLAANYTAPIATTVREERWKSWGLKGVLSPSLFLDKIGLYSLEEPDPSRIPVVMAHGLLSKPETWTAVYNNLLADRRIRENYQFYFFYYPTGLPPLYPGAGLRRELAELHAHLRARGGGRNINRMVLIGHSMGGLMVSAQVRDFRGAWEDLFTIPFDEAPLSAEAREAVETLFHTPPPRYVTRAVFVATPHRGSTLANNWVGRIGSSLAKVPDSFMSLQAPELVGSMTDFGRSVLLTADPLDGIYRLREDNPVLKLTESRPLSPWVTLHSIIGDEGRGDTPESTDGIVPYRSSHLPGVRSEKIVPCGHSAHLHAQGQAEIRRILLDHLRG